LAEAYPQGPAATGLQQGARDGAAQLFQRRVLASAVQTLNVGIVLVRSSTSLDCSALSLARLLTVRSPEQVGRR
jgi:hypothetical protein